MGRIQFIFNADDFGRSEYENRAIATTVIYGIIRSITVMANMVAAAEISLLNKVVPTLGVGVHINLTEGKPILAAEKVPSLVDGKGYFLPKPRLIARFFAGKVSLKELEEEAKAQIDTVSKLVGEVTHIDSHQNIHGIPGIMSAVIKACLGKNIKKIRSQREIIVPELFSQNSFEDFFVYWQRLKKGFGNILQRRIHRAGLYSPAPLLNRIPGHRQEAIYWQDNLLWWQKILPKLQSGIYEICLHPGSSPAQAVLFSSDEIRNLLEKYNCSSITYKYL